MTSSGTPSPTSLFGIELADVWASLVRPWRNLYDFSWLRWLRPEAPVLLLQVDGSESIWSGPSKLAGVPKARASFVALEVPEDLLLRRSLILPLVSADDVRSAVELEVTSASPFESRDVAFGHRQRVEGARQIVDIVFASRQQVAQYLDKKGPLAHGTPPAEVWVSDGLNQPIMLQGYGEERRLRYLTSRWRLNGALVLVALALLAAMVLTPTIQLRLRAIQAIHAYEDALRRAAPLLQQREKLIHAGDQIAALGVIASQRVDAAYVMDYLTTIIPDDTTLTSLNVQGSKVTFSGLTGNAAALMQRLSSSSGVRDVRAPAPATRPLGSPKETFSVELMLVPASTSDSVSSGRGAAETTPSTAATPQSTPSSSLPPQQRASSPFSIGGVTGTRGVAAGGSR